MARLARLVVPGLPHHITQRGNRRQQTFLCDQDYAAYVELMAEWCLEGGVEVWAYCLMPNHVHLIAMPQAEDGLRRAIGLLAATRYVELNPVRAGLLVDAADWRGFLNSAIQEEELRDLREHGRTGCPLGSVTFVQRLEQSVGRVLRPRNPGRPHKLLKRP